MRERTTAVWRSFTFSPGTTSARSTTVSTSRPRHAWMIRSSCSRLSLTMGSVGSAASRRRIPSRSEEHTSELQSRENLVCRLLLEKKKKKKTTNLKEIKPRHKNTCVELD